MMKKYNSYKDSGIKWIGEIPEHWDFAKINYYSSIKTGGTPNKERSEYWENGTIKWMSSGEVNKEYVYDVAERITEEGFKNSNASLLPVDTVMIALNGQGKTKGTVAVLKTETTCNQSLAGFICNKERLNPLYLFFFLKSKYKQLRGLVGDGQREGITLSLLKSLHTPLPPINEQAVVAGFLFSKTSQIDMLIQKKKQIIALLEEEKIAVINEAVTKGLNPDAPTKDSGVEWLSDVPAHWEVKKLKYAAQINPSKSEMLRNASGDDLVTFLPMEKVSTDGQVDTTIKRPINEVSSGFTFFQEYDVILAKITPCFENGKGAYLDALDGNFGFGSTEFHVLRPIENTLIGKYLYYITRTHSFKNLGEAGMTGAAGQKRVPTEFLLNYYLAYPASIDEQQEIVDYIQDNHDRIDTIISKASSEIQLLQEYRTALISETVTGKIDVRDYQPESITSTALA